MKISIVIIAFLTLHLSSCRSYKIIITSTYIIDEHPELSSFKISKIYPLTVDKPPSRFSVDSVFQFYILTDKNFTWNNKILFSKPMPGFKWVPARNAPNQDTIGALERNAWFLIENLHPFKYKFFVNVDNEGVATTYRSNASNF